ncbi:MAG: DJ-1/PfpI family protein [Alphaproteobacteria bacterium]|nr:DJ-1/PfpI family protein [Alphaproteobacteria bacterium]
MSLHSGFVIFPNLTQLDFTGPLQVLARLPGWKAHIVAKTMDPVPSDCGLSLVPTATFETAPPLDLICIPGGFGVDQAVEDEATIAYVRAQGARARYVTSVCTGAFILGAAGLLKGKRATTHWAYHALLAKLGATPEPGRVVRDGALFTGGGVTAGIDFALTLAHEIAGPEVAQAIQLALEYDPAPPFNAGSPALAPAPVRAIADERFAPRLAAFAEILDRAAARV